MKKVLVVLVLAFLTGMGVGTGALAARHVEAQAQKTYQVDLWYMGSARGGNTSVDLYYYGDDVMRCVAFVSYSNGTAPVCFDKRPALPPSAVEPAR